MMSAGMAQHVDEGELAMIYFAPQNKIILLFDYTVEVREAGRFSRYAESMLGVSDAVKDNRVIYQLENVHIGSRTEADTTRVRKIVAESGIDAQLLSINHKGLLEGYNLRPVVTDKKDQPKAEQPAVTTVPQTMPLTDEQLDLPTEEARAEAVAKQIYRIRESRMYLLSGEVEHAPTDGQAMQVMLDQLRAEEKALVSLFVGSTTTRREQKEICLMPGQESQEHILLYFSEENGFTESENLEADSIIVNMTHHRQVYAASNEQAKGKKAKNAPQPSQLIYNLPGSTDVTVTYRERTLGEQSLPIAQLGIDVPLTRDLFTGQKLPVIRIDVSTGNIQSICK